MFGDDIESLPADVAGIYEEARVSITVEAHTGVVMLCRKILMNVAVSKGAPENLPFVEYVEWLLCQRYVPRGSEGWVDYIRSRGNEANHEISQMGESDAAAVLTFTEQLLRNVFELPSWVPKKKQTTETS